MEIIISENIRQKLPDIHLGCFRASVKVRPSEKDLLQFVEQEVEIIKDCVSLEDISRSGIIGETREAYRRLGKDPARYRPSAEALTRRILQGKDLYQVNNVVDTLNIISLRSGFSIGGYDLDQIDRKVMLGIGESGEPYEAIGRGLLNIEKLPVLRDSSGAFGSPTSDSRRTMVRDETRTILMVFFDFMGSGGLEELLKETRQLYLRFCDVKNIRTDFIR